MVYTILVAQHCFQCQVFISVFEVTDDNIIIKLDFVFQIGFGQANYEKHLCRMTKRPYRGFLRCGKVGPRSTHTIEFLWSLFLDSPIFFRPRNHLSHQFTIFKIFWPGFHKSYRFISLIMDLRTF